MRDAARIGKAFVERLSGVFLHVNALHSYLFSLGIYRDFDKPMLRQRPVVLRDLISLGKVRIEVVLTRPLRIRVDGAVQTDARLHRHRYRRTIENRQSPWQTEAHRTRVHVRWFAKLRRAGAKELGIREELRVALETDHSFVLRIHSGYDCSILRTT